MEEQQTPISSLLPSARSTFEAVTRLQLDTLRDEVAELKRRVNGLLWTVAVAVIVDLVKTLLQ